MKILLVNPNSSTDAASPPQVRVPYGILYPASTLENNGHEVQIVDRNTDPNGIEDVIRRFWPDLVGVSVMTGPCILDALFISRLTKRISPDTRVVWGGVHPSLFPSMSASEASVDYVVRREGDFTVVELCEAICRGGDLREVKGISYRTGDGICHTPDRPFLSNLDELPYPAWHLIDIEKYVGNRLDGRKYLSMNTSRGCPYCCAFCYNRAFNEFKWRGLSVERVVEQIHYLVSEYGIGFVEFLEDNFTVSKKRLLGICDSLIRDNVDILWYCESRVGFLERETLIKMKRSGCSGIGFGVESGSPRILKLIKKNITVDQTIQTFRLCKELEIMPDAYVMVGLPHETIDDFRMTLQLIETIPYRMCDLMVYRPYPGTELYDVCIAEGLFRPPGDLEAWAEISDLHSAKFSVGQIPEAMIRSAKRKTLARNRCNSVVGAIRDAPLHRLAPRLPRFLFDTMYAAFRNHQGE